MGGTDAPPFMLVVNDRYAGVLLEALVRGLFRYRSELAPVGIGLGLGVAGAVLHATHPAAWPWIALCAAGVTGAVLKGWLLRGLDRLVSRDSVDGT